MTEHGDVEGNRLGDQGDVCFISDRESFLAVKILATDSVQCESTINIFFWFNCIRCVDIEEIIFLNILQFVITNLVQNKKA